MTRERPRGWSPIDGELWQAAQSIVDALLPYLPSHEFERRRTRGIVRQGLATALVQASIETGVEELARIALCLWRKGDLDQQAAELTRRVRTSS